MLEVATMKLMGLFAIHLNNINVNVNMYICARLMMYKITRLQVQDVA